MLKKLVAGLTAIALSLGMVALTTAPAGATFADECHTFDRTALTWNWNDQVVLSFQGVTLTKPAGGHNDIGVSGATPSSITIYSNGGTQDRTGQTVLNGAYGSDIQWVEICVTAAPPTDPTPYVLVAWVMPSWIDSTTPTWSQSYFTKIDLATKDLNALDGQLTACNVDYQVDLYNDSATTAALIAGGVLNGPNNPAEDFPSPSGWGLTYKLIHNDDCRTTPGPATFTPAQCVAGAPGTASYTIPSTPGVTYSVQINGTGGFGEKSAGTYDVPVGTTVEVKAKALSGHALTGTTEWSTTFATPDCRVKPVEPTFVPAVCSTADPGEHGKASYTIPVTEGVKYQVRINDGSWSNKAAGTYEVAARADVEVRAVALPGYTLKGKTKWSVDFKVPDCLTDVVPTKPLKAEAVCTGAEQVGSASFTIPQIAGVTYQRLVDFVWVDVAPGVHSASDGELVIVRAVPLPGYELTEHDWLSNKKTYLLLFDNLEASKDCIVPDAPAFDPQECTAAGDPSQATYTIPSDAGVKYQIWNGSTWETIAAGSYDVDSFPTEVKIRAVPKPSHHFFAGATTEWIFNFVPIGDCILGAPVDPVVGVDQKCVVDDLDTGAAHYESGTITIPNTPNVTYFVNGVEKAAGVHDYAPGTYNISAEADLGYELEKVPDPWTVTIKAAEPCGQLIVLPVVDPGVTFAQTTCSASGSYTLAVAPAEEAAGVIWSVSGGLPNTLGTHSVATAGAVTITATPAPGYGFSNDDDAFMQWSFDFTTLPDDCLPTLALTGAPVAAGLVGLWSVLTAVGVLLILARKRETAANAR